MDEPRRRLDDIYVEKVWEDVKYIRNKVDSLERKVYLMFGAFSVIGLVFPVVLDLITKVRP